MGVAVDVSSDLATVSAIASRALVTAMMTDSWERTREWFGRWLSRGHAESEQIHLERLDRDREAVRSATPESREERVGAVQARWAGRLEDLAELDPEAAELLVELTQQWMAEHPEDTGLGAQVRQEAKASGHARIIQVGRDQNITRKGLQ
jgi:hypothetical protein